MFVVLLQKYVLFRSNNNSHLRDGFRIIYTIPVGIIHHTYRIPTFWKLDARFSLLCSIIGEIVKIVNSYISLTTRAIVGSWNWMTDSDIISGSRIWKFVVEYDVQSQGDGVVAIAWFNHTFTSIPNPRPATSRMKVQALLRITYVLVLCTFAHLIHHFTD